MRDDRVIETYGATRRSPLSVVDPERYHFGDIRGAAYTVIQHQTINQHAVGECLNPYHNMQCVCRQQPTVDQSGKNCLL